jgi:hypothetical protein
MLSFSPNFRLYLDSCVKCRESKWKNGIHLDDDDQSISSSKRCFGQDVVIVSNHNKTTEAVYVTTYCAPYEVACRRLHK